MLTSTPRIPIIVDPTGDTEVRTQSVVLIVSSKVLTLASPVFAALLQLSFFDTTKVIVAADEDEGALALVMHILHFRVDRIPSALSLPDLAKLAGVCRKYGCLAAVWMWAQHWLKMWDRDDTRNPKDWLAWLEISYSFNMAEIFRWASKMAVLHSNGREFGQTGPCTAAEKRTLFVGNLSSSTTKEHILELFKDFSVESVYIPTHTPVTRFAFVSLRSSHEVPRAILQINDRTLLGNKIYVEYSTEPNNPTFPDGVLRHEILSHRSHLISVILLTTTRFFHGFTSNVAGSQPCLAYGDTSKKPSAPNAAFCEALVLGGVLVGLGHAGLYPAPQAPYPGITVYKVLVRLGRMVIFKEAQHEACHEALVQKKRRLLESITEEVKCFRGFDLKDIKKMERAGNTASLQLTPSQDLDGSDSTPEPYTSPFSACSGSSWT